MDGNRQWPTEWMRGALALCVLAMVAEGEIYGYAIAQRLRGAGLGAVKGGTLYPVLARLEVDGLVISSWREGEAGPGRKFFTITDAGLEELRARIADWRTFTDKVATVINKFDAQSVDDSSF
ncbi:PadR family transcriptional regulator [Micromonospora sp. LOL_015]|uniref:PadR family transcriptional regulator n=1 Tax=Micromonospora sp. LOL_015 TaxID=3345416 RepID=UPI003A89C6BD